MHQKEIQHPELPFTVRIKEFFPNSIADNRKPDSTEPPAATRDIGARATVKSLPRVTDNDRRDMPSAVIELISGQSSLGTWLVSEYLDRPQQLTLNNRVYEISLRSRRYYRPFSIQLLKFNHDIYAGTDIPKNFASRVILHRPETGEKREVLIYMNSPLRYSGETFYQASFDPDDHGSILQVVHNPGWLTPYFSCILVGLGLAVQFGTYLFSFAMKGRTA